MYPTINPGNSVGGNERESNSGSTGGPSNPDINPNSNSNSLLIQQLQQPNQIYNRAHQVAAAAAVAAAQAATRPMQGQPVPRPPPVTPIIQQRPCRRRNAVVPKNPQGFAKPQIRAPRPLYPHQIQPIQKDKKPAPYSIAALIGLNESPSPPPAPTQEVPFIYFRPSPQTTHIYSNGGIMLPRLEFPQRTAAATSTCTASSLEVFAPPGEIARKQRRLEAHSDVLHSFAQKSGQLPVENRVEEEGPQDLRVRKVAPPQADPIVFNGVAAVVSVLHPIIVESPPPPEQISQHKKLNYKKWTDADGNESATCSSAASGIEQLSAHIQGTSQQHQDLAVAARIPAVPPTPQELEKTASNLRLSPFITREQAASRLTALKDFDEVQREIDNYGVLIRMAKEFADSKNPTGTQNIQGTEVQTSQDRESVIKTIPYQSSDKKSS